MKKRYYGWFKAGTEIEVDENATEEEIRDAIVDSLEDVFMVMLDPNTTVITIEEIVEDDCFEPGRPFVSMFELNP